jgi:hypothetical protein
MAAFLDARGSLDRKTIIDIMRGRIRKPRLEMVREARQRRRSNGLVKSI